MKMSLAQKLVTAFLGLTLLVLAATLGLARWSFEQGFLDYVNALEQIRLERLQNSLAREYVNAGRSWESLTPARFDQLLNRSSEANKRDGFFPEGAPPPRREGHRPPPQGRKPPPPLESTPGPPTALFDQTGNLLAGSSADLIGADVMVVPVEVDGIAVGELHSVPKRRLNTPLETAFSRQQLTNSWIIGVSSMALAFAISLLLAKGLMTPIRRMIKHVGQLSNGQYSQRLNESRSDELGQLTRDLDHLGKTLEENQTSRQRLLADISHELRTPLSVLTGEIEALQDGLRPFNADQLTSLDQEVQRLRRLVDDLYELSLSELGGLKYKFSPVNIGQCMSEAADTLRHLAAQKQVRLDVPYTNSTLVRADPTRLHQLFCNLIQNALAYTDSPGQVVVKLAESKRGVTITIDDTPPGVSAEHCDKLFEPLYRDELSRSRRSGGAGLGMAICKNIVEAHGGRISASPSRLGGLRVKLEIPLATENGQ